ncbi:hypothetical protein EDM52_00305 [Brevibacillus invocatus]|uniref:Uncharacterized protein n=1 Tax=Brevibacillus invocatus TaxID=173959 RepID=A0A3M8CPN7_9BACL|nr:hypothetical protein [Brevibacillus invocatus]RNB77267.1 hypothetical protein EDM52_00305 [Brevibacillus invocatus]
MKNKVFFENQKIDVPVFCEGAGLIRKNLWIKITGRINLDLQSFHVEYNQMIRQKFLFITLLAYFVLQSYLNEKKGEEMFTKWVARVK